MESESDVAQSCPTLCDPVDCSPPGSSVHGILQARLLEWVAISFSRIYMSNLHISYMRISSFYFFSVKTSYREDTQDPDIYTIISNNHFTDKETKPQK